MRKIIPFLWFDDKAEEAARYYASIFRRSKIVKITRYDETGATASGRPMGSVMTVEFRLEGQEFVALNGGPQFAFSPAISFVVNCRTQGEIDELWGRLSRDGETMQCGWLKDKYGVTWQVVPAAMGRWLSDPDPARSQRVMQALVQMTKLDMDALEKAYGRKPRAAAVRRRSPRPVPGKSRRAAGLRGRGKRAAA